ncbi:putative oxidoreductase [Mariniphaga anaerophila]|uniref:Putative oxidoreductase n=1 Tax=Mariniphaga anaerophila TaxID=1484053 RepID=A0A1M4VMS9_9BACT|nr:DoxX family protein [Mariniphaga anaerophila]SHE70163.1 putative oxidoreductase [Mariniphaga anaerophila]
MKKLLINTLPLANVNFALLLLRAGVALMMLTHGYPKLMHLLSGEPITFPAVPGLGVTLSFVLTVFAEFLCSILVLLGLGTRLSAIPLAITMAVAAFYAHGSDPFASKEMALLYLTIFVVLALTGGGKYSVDHVLARSSSKR